MYCCAILKSWSTWRQASFYLSSPIYTFSLTLSWTLYISLAVVVSVFISSSVETSLSHSFTHCLILLHLYRYSTIYGTPLSTSNSSSSSSSCTTGVITPTSPLYFPRWRRWPIRGYELIFFILCTRRWLCPGRRQHREWIPFFGIHLGELSSIADGDV